MFAKRAFFFLIYKLLANGRAKYISTLYTRTNSCNAILSHPQTGRITHVFVLFFVLFFACPLAVVNNGRDFKMEDLLATLTSPQSPLLEGGARAHFRTAVGNQA